MILKLKILIFIIIIYRLIVYKSVYLHNKFQKKRRVKMSKKIQTIVVDTLNEIQNKQYMGLLDTNTMVSRDKWKDFGVDIYMFMQHLKDLGFETVLILGYEGTGKSFGIKKLEPGTNLWFNSDKKNATFKEIEFDGKTYSPREIYGTKNNPTKYMTIPKTYKEIISYVEGIKKGGMLDENPVAFLIGHVEDYKTSEGEMRQRLKTLGGLATKMNIEGSVEYCLYSSINVQGEKVEYKFDTKNSGTNTGRSSEGAFKTKYIDNDFNLIYNAIKNY